MITVRQKKDAGQSRAVLFLLFLSFLRRAVLVRATIASLIKNKNPSRKISAGRASVIGHSSLSPFRALLFILFSEEIRVG